MLRRARITLGMLATMLAAGNACALSKEAQEFMNIQSKMAPDQCELQRLSSQAASAQRAGDLGKRQELDMQMEPVVKRLQANQPRIQEPARLCRSAHNPGHLISRARGDAGNERAPRNVEQGQRHRPALERR